MKLLYSYSKDDEGADADAEEWNAKEDKTGETSYENRVLTRFHVFTQCIR